MLKEFGLIGIFLLGGFAFTFAALITSWLIRPKRPGREKESTYECGVETEGYTWVQFKINYFMYALMFVVFDIETVFLYPWAVIFGRTRIFTFVEMSIFVGTLLLGLWYAYKKGALEWK